MDFMPKSFAPANYKTYWEKQMVVAGLRELLQDFKSLEEFALNIANICNEKIISASTLSRILRGLTSLTVNRFKILKYYLKIKLRPEILRDLS